MKKYNVLIVEDESEIAEFHADFLRSNKYFKPIGIASTYKQAQSMVLTFKPDLILLDNYLPDGKGIDFLKYNSTLQQPQNIIFITAANDMETVRKAIRLGCFDYLIKPISYVRLQNSLDRFFNYMNTLQSSDRLNQQYIDRIINYQSKATTSSADLPKGIDQITLNLILSCFSDATITHTTGTLIDKVNISKTTARRYLEYCTISGFLEAEIKYGQIGRPERMYKKRSGT